MIGKNEPISVLGIYGAGPLGREIYSILGESNLKSNLDGCFVCFIDDSLDVKEVNGITVLDKEKFLNLNHPNKHFIIGIANPNTRAEISKAMENAGCIPLTVISSTANLFNSVSIGIGSVVFPNTTISTETNLGSYVIVNSQSYIGHNVHLGDYVTISPGVTICGFVNVKKMAFLGAGSCVMPGTKDLPKLVGDSSLVGLGAVVVESVNDGETVIGNPARKLLSKNA
jgi:sugar O-acyltransferase (sialic acid O-acetyltransferase NeuD family)